MNNVHIKRTELYKTKGNIKIPLPKEENTHTMYELNETLVEIITKKYVGGSTDETTD